MYIEKFKLVSVQLMSIMCFVLVAVNVNSAVVDLPEITEVPEIKEETLLKDLDIPAVRDRDPDPEAGPRLSISEFRLQGIVEYPELGITRKEISRIVEEIRFDMMGEGKLLESGHTLEELGEISDLLSDIEKNVEEEHVGPEEVQRLVWLVRDQMLKRGVTLGMIETVADRITRYYRERGFILAKAYIPKQKVRDGVVTLTLLLGMLGEVKVNDSNLYDDDVLSAAFDDLLTKPVTNTAISERLYLINDLPGVTTQGFFESGSQVGDTLLNVNVKAEEVFDYNLRVDNHGAEETGKERLYGDILWNNPTGTADQLHLATLYAEGTVYGQLRYNTNYFSPRLKIGLGYANNSFVLGKGASEAIVALGLEGETEITDLSVSYKYKRGLNENYSFDFVHENIDSAVKLTSLSDDGGRILDDEVRNSSLGFNYDFITQGSRLLHQGNVRFMQGEFIFGAEDGQDESYSILKADYSLLSFWKIPFTDIETRSVLRASTQLSNSALSSINQFSLGGPARARAFEAKEFSADQALYVGFDWFFNLPGFLDFEMDDTTFGKVLSPFIFIDAAHGEAKSLIELTDEEQEIDAATSTLINAGVGIQFSLDNMSGNLQVAFPIENKYDDGIPERLDGQAPPAPPELEKETRVLLEFQYRF